MERSSMPTKLRKPETWERYQNAPKYPVGFLSDPDYVTIVKEFDYWVIVENDYPYDAITDTHHMLVPRDVYTSFEDVSDAAAEELDAVVREYINENYDATMENTMQNRTVPTHIHLHLLTFTRV